MKRIITLALLCTTSCASIAHQTTQQIAVASNPPGAAVTVACGDVQNDPKLVTPTVVTVHRKPAVCLIQLTKDGYTPGEVRLKREMSGWYIGNLLIGGIIGFIVDGANGAIWNRTPGRVEITLNPTATSGASQP